MRYVKKWELNVEYNMTHEEKELLLKDLCGRLPYGVKVQIKNEIVVLDSICNDDGYYFNFIGEDREGVHIGNIKPYLFPLSSMTVEQRCKAQNLLPDKCEISFINSKITFYGENCCEIRLEQFDKLFKFFDSQHVDYRGLIPMGAAIDASGKNIY